MPSVVTKHPPVQLSLLQALLTGLVSSGPGPEDELGEPSHGPARLELPDDVEQVKVAVDAEQGAIVDEGVGGGEPLAPAGGPGEEVVAATDGEVADAALDATVVDLETTIQSNAERRHAD
jgi:hypothetical protein